MALTLERCVRSGSKRLSVSTLPFEENGPCNSSPDASSASSATTTSAVSRGVGVASRRLLNVALTAFGLACISKLIARTTDASDRQSNTIERRNRSMLPHRAARDRGRRGRMAQMHSGMAAPQFGYMLYTAADVNAAPFGGIVRNLRGCC